MASIIDNLAYLENHKFSIFTWRITAVHMITYFMVGILSLNIFNYSDLFSSGNLQLLLRPTDSPWVALGPLIQVIRGLIFAVALSPFKSVFLFTKGGWLKLWLLLIGLSILSTLGPSLGSIEGLIYTKIPFSNQLIFLPELIVQSLFLSLFIYYWYQEPKKILDKLALILVSIIAIMSIAGFAVR